MSYIFTKIGNIKSHYLNQQLLTNDYKLLEIIKKKMTLALNKPAKLAVKPTNNNQQAIRKTIPIRKPTNHENRIFLRFSPRVKLVLSFVCVSFLEILEHFVCFSDYRSEVTLKL